MALSKFVKSLTPQHEAMVTWFISNPGGSQRECAAALDMSEHQISIIRNSDIFRAYWQQRMADHHNNVSESVIQKTEKVASATLDEIHSQITDEEAEPVPLPLLTDVAGTTLKALGFGRDSRHSSPVNILVGVSSELLEAARDKMRRRAADSAEEVSGEVLEVTSESIDTEVPAA